VNPDDHFIDPAEFGFETRAIHAGQPPDESTGAVVTPIHPATTFSQEEVGKHRGFEYARTGNPTRAALERCLASLEGATFGAAFASGLAAEDAILRGLRPGEHIVMGTDAYGGTFRLIDRVHGPMGITATAVDLTDHAATVAAFRPSTKLVWVETPTNPLLTIVDIAVVAGLAHERGAKVVVDNTFATPYLQQPLALGADIVVHSTTKYLGGHSDVLGGAVVVNDSTQVRGESLAEKVAFLQFGVGAVSGPMDAWLTVRGIKTLAVRMDRHSSNAQTIAQKLVGHPKLERVYYPGLPDHPGHELAARQMRSFGGMISVQLADGATARRFAESTTLFQLAESLGGVESLVCYPAEMTHASVKGTLLEVPETVVRLSVGIEGVDDLLDDLLDALDRL
jgi:cystathionine gamma-synthase